MFDYQVVQQREIALYRKKHNLPEFKQQDGTSGTVALVDAGGTKTIGTNSTLLKESYKARTGKESKQLEQQHKARKEEARLLLEQLHKAGKLKDLSTLQDAQFLSHAEADALTQAYKRLGKLPEVVEIFSDRLPCPSCSDYLAQLAQHYGASQIRFYWKNMSSNTPLIRPKSSAEH